MSSAAALPITQTITPADRDELAATLKAAHDRQQAIYPIGGGTSLNYGLTPTRPGLGLSLAGLSRIVDYPARDMTITLEAGVTLETVARTLAAERQWLPIDVPLAGRATIGGVVATAFCGPRRHGQGTPRDYVIGIRAVDGRGRPFRAGGQVVKNVAGYDLCKLLTGSLGTLGVISEVSLKVKQSPQRSAFLLTDVTDLDRTDRLLAALVTSGSRPTAIELLVGPSWRDHEMLGLTTAGIAARLLVGLEGTADEVEWMLGQLDREWHGQGQFANRAITGDAAATVWRDLTEFPAGTAPLVVKASVPPSHTTALVSLIARHDPNASILAHAGNGIVIARISRFEAADVSRVLIGQWQPAAELAGGSLVVLSTALEGLTRQAVWGGATSASPWLDKVKAQFDPRGILNPGRFVY